MRWPLVLVAATGCSAFDTGDNQEAAMMFHATTLFAGIASQSCEYGGMFSFPGDDTAGQLSLDHCNFGGGEVTTTAPITVTFTAQPDVKVTTLDGSFAYHLEGVSVGTEDTCDLAMTITTTTTLAAGTFHYRWVGSGTMCGAPIDYGCEDPEQDCFD
jgi:hypothetical protein